VVLDQIDAYSGQLEHLAATDPPRCADDPRLPPNDPALDLCAALVREIVSGQARRAELLEAVERHELQHQLDGPTLRHSRVVLERLGHLDRGEQAKVDRELSAYLAQAATAPRLTLVRLFQLAIAQRGALDRAVAFLALEALAQRPTGDVHGAADAFTDLARLPETQIRTRAGRAHERLFGGAPVTPAELLQ
jgi:hypothetical protein